MAAKASAGSTSTSAGSSSTEWIRDNQRHFAKFGDEAIGDLVDSAAGHFAWLANYMDDIEEAVANGSPVLRDSSSFGTIRQLKIPKFQMPKMSSDDDTDEPEESFKNPFRSMAAATSRNAPLSLASTKTAAVDAFALSTASLTSAPFVKSVTGAAPVFTADSALLNKPPSSHPTRSHGSAPVSEPAAAVLKRVAVSDSSPLKRARLVEEFEEKPAGPIVVVPTGVSGKSKILDSGVAATAKVGLRASEEMVAVEMDTGVTTGFRESEPPVVAVVAVAAPPQPREEKHEIRKIKGRLAGLKKKFDERGNGSGASGASVSAGKSGFEGLAAGGRSAGSGGSAGGSGVTESMFSGAEESRQEQKKSMESMAEEAMTAMVSAQVPSSQQQPQPPLQDERPTTRSFNASLAKISKLVKSSKTSKTTSTTSASLAEDSSDTRPASSSQKSGTQKSSTSSRTPDVSVHSPRLSSPPPASIVEYPTVTEIPISAQLLPSTAASLHPAPSMIDSDGDVDMSIEDYHIAAEEIAFDSIDPEQDTGKGKVFVGNTQKPEAMEEEEEEEEEEDVEMECDVVVPKTPAPGGGGGERGGKEGGGLESEQGWGAGIMRIGEKLVSNFSAFLPSPSKGSAPSAPAPTYHSTPSAIPKPLFKPENHAHHAVSAVSASLKTTTTSTSTAASTTATTSRLVLKKDAGVRAKEAIRKQHEEEKRVLEAKEKMEKKQREERRQKELMEAAKKIPAAKPKTVSVQEHKREVIVLDSDDEDMELCSQPQQSQQGGRVKPVSKIPGTSKLPMAAASSAATDFAVPLPATKNLKAPTPENATPKSYPRHHPTNKPVQKVHSILKPATPSFDAKLEARIKEGLVKPELPAPYNKAIVNPILGGLYDAPVSKKGGSSSSSVSSSSAAGAAGGKNKKNSGPATIVDENGELPEIPDSDDENDEDSSEDDDGHAKTPAAAKPEPKKAAVPSWVETPNLMRTLTQQTVRDPDEIFGSVKPLVLEDVFKGGRVQRKFRDSMAGNWVGNGELTPEEEEQYKQQMGFH
ncbi:hypothetical protein HDU98_008213 [Podochytrium sp. JEL0797]|nr:hypothetical protein HDU98_008213 [Podochytrium sp. JEL0797]